MKHQCENGCGESRMEMQGHRLCMDCYGNWLAAWKEGRDYFAGNRPLISRAGDQNTQLGLFR